MLTNLEPSDLYDDSEHMLDDEVFQLNPVPDDPIEVIKNRLHDVFHGMHFCEIRKGDCDNNRSEVLDRVSDLPLQDGIRRRAQTEPVVVIPDLTKALSGFCVSGEDDPDEAEETCVSGSTFHSRSFDDETVFAGEDKTPRDHEIYKFIMGVAELSSDDRSERIYRALEIAFGSVVVVFLAFYLLRTGSASLGGLNFQFVERAAEESGSLITFATS